MNIENIRLVRNVIANLPPERFNMNYWAAYVENEDDVENIVEVLHNCGTVACIGGWTNAIFGDETESTYDAAKHLGLSDRTAHSLFYPWGISKSFDEITIDEAIQVLDHLIETGEVDWSIVQ